MSPQYTRLGDGRTMLLEHYTIEECRANGGMSRSAPASRPVTASRWRSVVLAAPVTATTRSSSRPSPIFLIRSKKFLVPGGKSERRDARTSRRAGWPSYATP